MGRGGDLGVKLDRNWRARQTGAADSLSAETGDRAGLRRCGTPEGAAEGGTKGYREVCWSPDGESALWGSPQLGPPPAIWSTLRQ